jgi:hypothetical protein
VCAETGEESDEDKDNEEEEVEGALGMFEDVFGKHGRGTMMRHLYGREWEGTVSEGVKGVWNVRVEDEDVRHVLRVYDRQETESMLSKEECVRLHKTVNAHWDEVRGTQSYCDNAFGEYCVGRLRIAKLGKKKGGAGNSQMWMDVSGEDVWYGSEGTSGERNARGTRVGEKAPGGGGQRGNGKGGAKGGGGKGGGAGKKVADKKGKKSDRGTGGNWQDMEISEESEDKAKLVEHKDGEGRREGLRRQERKGKSGGEGVAGDDSGRRGNGRGGQAGPGEMKNRTRGERQERGEEKVSGSGAETESE